MTARSHRARAMAMKPATLDSEPPLLMSCVTLGNLLFLSEPPFPHMLNALPGGTEQIIRRALCRLLGAVYPRG